MISPIRKATLCIVFLLSLVWYASIHFYRDPGSVFFDETRAFEQQYSKFRHAEVRELIEEVSKGSPGGHGGDDVFPSGSSENCKFVRYYKLSEQKGEKLLREPERKDLYINTLNAETTPTNHPSWITPWLHTAVDKFQTYSFHSHSEEKYISSLSQKGTYAEKSIYDYTTALQSCFETGTPYIVLIEDDVLFAEGWMMQALSGLNWIPTFDSEHREWLFMRLFNQERSMGWAGKKIGENHEFPIIVGIISGISLLSIFLRRQWPRTRQFLDWETLIVILIILIPGLVILFYQSGKASLLPPSPGLFEEAFGCYSQALIFPRESIPVIIEFMREQKSGHFDLMLDQLAVEVGL